MKECSGKKVLKAKVAQNDPLDSPSQKNWPGGQQDQGHEVVLHVQEEVYWWTLTFRRSVAKYHGGSMRCPKFRNYDVSPGTKHKRGAKSRVKKLSVTRDQSSIFFLEVYPIPFLGLDLIDPRSSFLFIAKNYFMLLLLTQCVKIFICFFILDLDLGLFYC